MISQHARPHLRSIHGMRRYGNFAWIVLSFLIFLCSHANAQTLTGHEDFSVSLTDAAIMTQRVQSTADAANVPVVQAEYFGRDAIEAVLKQPNCVGLRIYFARKSTGELAQVIVGVDANGHDLTSGLLLEQGFPCPPICDMTSNLLKH